MFFHRSVESLHLKSWFDYRFTIASFSGSLELSNYQIVFCYYSYSPTAFYFFNFPNNLYFNLKTSMHTWIWIWKSNSIGTFCRVPTLSKVKGPLSFQAFSFFHYSSSAPFALLFPCLTLSIQVCSNIFYICRSFLTAIILRAHFLKFPNQQWIHF